jgi:hypothetical protein
VPSVFNLNISECKQYVFNGKTYTNTGVYRDTLFGASASGCDSVIVLNLSLTKINKTLVKNGNSLVVQETGATYKWLNCQNNQIIVGETSAQLTPLVSGNYAAIITKNACVDTSNCTLVNLNNCNIGISYQILTTQDSIRCKEVTVKVSSATLPISLNISWLSNPTGNTIQLADSVKTYTEVCPETYWIRVTDALGCIDSLTFTILEPSVGLNEKAQENINLYPNPAQDLIYLYGIPKEAYITAYNMQGKLVLNLQHEGEGKAISCAHLSNGVYVLKIESEGKISSRKLIIQK